MIRIKIIGSGTAIPHIKRASPAIFINFNDKNILIDSGAGTLRRLKEANVDYLEIDYFMYTHLHPDHTIELAAFLFAYRNPEKLRKKPLNIIGPPGFSIFFGKLYNLYGDWIKAQSYELHIIELKEGKINFLAGSLITKYMAHTENSIGYRIEYKGSSVAVSGDTDYCENIIMLGKEVDLLILECSFPDDKKVEGHLCPSLIADIVKQTSCKQLLLVHFYPVWDSYELQKELSPIYKVLSTDKVIIGTDFLELTI